MPRTKEDRREEVINDLVGKVDYVHRSDVKILIDQYATEVCLELLEYMAKKGVLCGEYKGELYFNPRDTVEHFTKEQLFENFL